MSPDGTWCWGCTLHNGRRVEVQAQSYREAVWELAAMGLGVQVSAVMRPDGRLGTLVANEAGVPVSIRIVGYVATPGVEVGQRPPHGHDRNLGGLALQLYAMLRVDFPVTSHLCMREVRWRFSPLGLRDFLADVGAILARLPAEERAAVEGRAYQLMRSYRHAAMELNLRRRRRQDDAEEQRTHKRACQRRAKRISERVAYRRGMEVVNAALDGMLPEQEVALRRWLLAIATRAGWGAGLDKHVARARTVSIPRL